MSFKKPVFLVTGADLAREALALLGDYEVVFAGKTPTEDDVVALCKRYDPVAIIVRYSKVGAAAMDAAPSLEVISKHGSGTDTIDKIAAKKVADETQRIADIKSRKSLRPGWLDGALRAAGVIKEGESL